MPSISGTYRFCRQAARQIDGRPMNRLLTHGWRVGRCQAPSERSHAIYSCGRQRRLERRIVCGSWLFSSTIPPRFAGKTAISAVRSSGGASTIRSARTSVTVGRDFRQIGPFASRLLANISWIPPHETLRSGRGRANVYLTPSASADDAARAWRHHPPLDGPARGPT
jgi:hypothetical protein